MNYYSLNQNSKIVSFKEAAIAGQAPDKGLYFPERIPALDPSLINNMSSISKEELAFQIMKPYVGDTIDQDSLYQIVSETIQFPFPLISVQKQIAALELYHGPTLAFKDVGARFMSRCLSYFTKTKDQKITVLVATSGDTGGAVANGFLGVEGVEVIILYPSGSVSQVQELQLTTCGQNIKALEVNGSFDDCQLMVKEAFMDPELNNRLTLTSANSINVARWIPQQLYYFFAYQQWEDKAHPPVFSVPSGNFGNLCAGLLAAASGLPVTHFIAACNVNDSVPSYLKTGVYHSIKSIPTISNAMDVGHPSNFVRILAMFENNYQAVKQHITGYTVSDEITKETIANTFQKTGYLLDPHGAVAFYALNHYIAHHENCKGIFLETAHPIKFPNTVEEIIGQKIEIPTVVEQLYSRKKQRIKINADYNDFKDWLMQNH